MPMLPRIQCLVVIACLALAPLQPCRAQPSPTEDKKSLADERPARTDLYGDPLPEGTLARMGTVQLRHERLASAVFSPAGKMIGRVGSDSLRLWEARTGKLVRQIKENVQYGAVLFSPDGRWLATGQANLLEPDTGRLLRRIPDAGSLLAASPDARLLAASARDGAVVLWDTTTGAQVLRLQGHE